MHSSHFSPLKWVISSPPKWVRMNLYCSFSINCISSKQSAEIRSVITTNISHFCTLQPNRRVMKHFRYSRDESHSCLFLVRVLRIIRHFFLFFFLVRVLRIIRHFCCPCTCFANHVIFFTAVFFYELLHQ